MPTQPNIAPLNGTKTHPLSSHALCELRKLKQQGPLPRWWFNPGLANRLLREALVESISLPSPHAVHKRRNIEYLRITQAGLAASAVKAP